MFLKHLYVDLYGNKYYIQIMAITYKATFRPEKRKYKGTGELIDTNVPLMLDLSYQGRSWYNTGIRLQNIDDFDVKAQKLKGGKRAIENKDTISATKVLDRLNSIKGHISEAFNDAKALKVDITAKYLIEQLQIRSGNKKVEVIEESTFIEDFTSAYVNWHKLGIIGENRRRQYASTGNIIARFLRVTKRVKLTSKEFTPDVLMELQGFMLDESNHIAKNPDIYNQLSVKEYVRGRGQNTVASKLTGLKTFFEEAEEKDIVSVSPFRKIAKREREAMLKEAYDEPIYLSIEELLTIVHNNCPAELKRVRDCFLLHCALGNRVGDFHSLTWNNVVYKDNFCYIHYVALKTSHQTNLESIDTPLVKFAYDIIKKYKDELPNELLVPMFINNVSGKDGYNKQIRRLLEYYKIDRGVVIRENGQLKTVPIFALASSKLCRKTHVDILTKVALNKYTSGLHKEGSKAVDRYTGLSIDEKYKLYCMAFRQEEYIL